MEPTSAEADAPRVFISHSSSDVAEANALVAALEEQGFPCWVAPRDILPGSRYGEAIIDGINACLLFVLLLSEHSNASPQVLAEVERAVSKGRSLVTVRLEDVMLSKSLEYFLSSFHWIDAFSPLETHRERLIDAVRPCADGRTQSLPGRVAKDQFLPDGVWFVELAPLADPALVAQASVLGVREDAGTPSSQRRGTRARR